MLDRRDFLHASATGLWALGLGPTLLRRTPPRFQISLAEWSLHRALQRKELDHLDFPATARRDYGIDAIELVNTFFKDKAGDQRYLADFRKRADNEGVRTLLIMCDGEGRLGDPDAALRETAITNHHRWVEAAVALGCHSIRVNAASSGSYQEQQRLAADGLRRLTEFGAGHQINIIVENHGGLSSNGAWLAGVMRLVNHPRCGTLPDFGNFCVQPGAAGEPCAEMYDRYQGVAELMPFAKAVSAKSHDFDDAGNETGTDFRRMLDIVVRAGYDGHLGIEYEGSRLSEPDGIRRTKELLERYRDA
ncbi:MAG: sugar phosphate isomerase/epimerase family protein [Gemmatimonadales bacterium]|nr:sugar phosphate isomerase/epimerase family protein [Gemmatimonadales bacterium]MDZ4391157.1 sugar phosphate isomerase/epimerase family protein [Gemmatimonadales bacterium]